MAESKPCKPPVLNELLIQNVNTWGNVQYNIPLRLSNNETRSSTSIAHRYIPAIPHSLDCKIDDPLPERVCGRDMVTEKETYRTTTGEYCVKPNPNKAMERSDCSINCRRVIFMTGVEKRLQGKQIIQPTMISEMKDNFRGVMNQPTMPPEVTVKVPDPEYIFDVKGFGPRHREIWMPLTAKVHRGVYDRIHVKKEYKEVAACHNPVNNIKG
ncbi:unnamed protein product [Diatraea saccharalis]|uniref:Uncharacterized protein n=1 Tax=Diatraea saccharalis TaxID=40085 RepID=A0A9N9R272_9NEOP|nr:unnamed protein product [Diatraea saccharalis]